MLSFCNCSGNLIDLCDYLASTKLTSTEDNHKEKLGIFVFIDFKRLLYTYDVDLCVVDSTELPI